jgi:hypothetical protein
MEEGPEFWEKLSLVSNSCMVFSFLMRWAQHPVSVDPVGDFVFERIS